VLGKLLSLIKKGVKKSNKSDKKAVDGGFDWPDGLRLGVFGHSNAGKTVYFTVLNEDCKVARDLQISINDNATAGELLSNYKKIWGVGTATGVGTVVDLREDKKFPEPTSADRLLQFTAILDGSDKLPVVTYDYPGDAVAIGEPNDFTEKAADFMRSCDGLLFMFDPKVLSAEMECQAHVAAFVNMLEKLAPLTKRLPIPVALVISKADILKGFNSDEQSVLISAEDEPIVCEDYEIFLNRVLTSNKIASDNVWAGTVRDVLVKLKEFIKVAVGRTLDFQVFFVSQTGESPQKIGAEVGRSIYSPPEKVRPVGVRKPMYWLLKAITRNQSLTKFRKFTKFVTMICLAWIVVVSGVYLWHFSFQLGRATAFEDDILERYNMDPFATNSDEQERIRKEYDRYKLKWLPSKLYRNFRPPVDQIISLYSSLESGSRTSKLDTVLMRLTAIVNNQSAWPTVDPSDNSIQEKEEHLRLKSDLETFTKGGDSTSSLFKRADRALTYWDLFKQCLVNTADSTMWNTLYDKIIYDQGAYITEINSTEKKMCEALLSGKTDTEKAVTAKQATSGLSGKIKEINDNNDPEYRLETAVEELKQIKSDLGASGNPADIKMIDKYLSTARRWSKKQEFTYRIDALPQDGHLHIEAVPEDEEAAWSEKTQLLPGYDNKITWKPGYAIYIAYDDITQNCNWGKKSSDSKVIREKYSLFDMEGEITLNSGTKVSISFKPSLEKKLPKLKK